MAAMIRVKNITDMGGVRAPLLEYDRTEGMIPFSELSPSRIRKPVIVLRVDREKGYIELSNKLVHSIVRHVAETVRLDLELTERDDKLLAERMAKLHAVDKEEEMEMGEINLDGSAVGITE
ncbi:unnamed protein product [Spirodela intermedia]|uniref:Uncharacterized protein n=1 Tax=Spirodela intermedia TaxID=51605 RepID=A0A7I8L0N3_SPIIN|nr:unnamed protein product [Spirodela intermedia]